MILVMFFVQLCWMFILFSVYLVTVNLSAEQRQWFLSYYRKLCQLGLSDSGIQMKRSPDKDPKMEGNQVISMQHEHVVYNWTWLCI